MIEKFIKLKRCVLATREDIETLRVNKNLNRMYFFLKEEISEEDQIKWFNGLISRKNDFMFICLDEESREKIGSIGFRIIEEKIDFYNIMRFTNSKTKIKDCLLDLINLVKDLLPDKNIQVRVLKDNPAVQWYKKIGFEIQKEENNFYVMDYKS